MKIWHGSRSEQNNIFKETEIRNIAGFGGNYWKIQKNIKNLIEKEKKKE